MPDEAPTPEPATVLGFLRSVKPSTWDVGAYGLGLFCLAKHAGLF